jgi:hypothetical protein
LDKSPGDSLLFKQSALRGVSYALTGHLVTTTIGRRRLVVVRSLLALLDTNMSN